MVVLSNELRNLLTEDSLNSIVDAGSAPNGHLIPKDDPLSEDVNTNIGGEDVSLKTVFQEKEVVNSDKLDDIEKYVKQNIARYDEYMSTMTKKMNDMIKGFNDIEKKLAMLESRAVANEQPKQEEQEKLAPNSPAQEVKEEKHQTHPRSLASLPPELSIESVFNCNGKTF